MKDKMWRHSGAQVGIGTLIIFIAMVLVAAVAAGVLINTSGILQQKAQATGKEATEEVSSNIMIQSIAGDRAYAEGNSTLADGIQLLDIRIRPSAGCAMVDLRQMIVMVSNGQRLVDIKYNSTGTLSTNLTWNEGGNSTYNGTNTFIAEAIRDEDQSFDTIRNPVMNSGDLIIIRVDLSADTGVNLDAVPRSNLRLTLVPETGTPVSVDLITPNSYGVNRIVNIYP